RRSRHLGPLARRRHGRTPAARNRGMACALDAAGRPRDGTGAPCLRGRRAELAASPDRGHLYRLTAPWSRTVEGAAASGSGVAGLGHFGPGVWRPWYTLPAAAERARGRQSL